MKQVLIRTKAIYGTQNAYPACEESRLLIELTGKKTFNKNDLSVIEKLGYQIQFKQEAISLENFRS